MPFIPHTEDDIREMLAAIGAPSIEALFDEIPPELRTQALAGVPVHDRVFHGHARDRRLSSEETQALKAHLTAMAGAALGVGKAFGFDIGTIAGAFSGAGTATAATIAACNLRITASGVPAGAITAKFAYATNCG